MRINTNVSALNSFRNLQMTQKSVSGSMEKLSSGFRINKAADDAAGLGIANQMRSTTRALTQASRNAEQANSVLQIAEGSTTSIQNMLERVKELATQAASDSTDADARTRIQTEVDALIDEIDRTVDTTKFQSSNLLGTSAASTAPAAMSFMVGSSGQYTTNDNVSISLDNMSSKALGSAGTKLEALKTGQSGVLDSVADAQAALTVVDDAIKTVNGQLGKIGAYQNRIDNAQANLKTSIQNFSAAESVIRDVDMAEEMTKFSKNQILSQAGTAMLAQANQSAQGVLQLLRG